MKQRTFPAATPPSQRVRRLFGAGSLLALLCAPTPALAQADIAPPPPNVLLLVDTSGSMDYKTGSNTFPSCHYSGGNVTAQTSERSRWIDLVEVLTGSIPSYDCQRLDRNSSDFKNEYSNPYDFLYPNPFHRPVSNLCVAGPGTLDASNKALFPSTAIRYHQYNNTATACTFAQAADGVLDAFESDVRFGLMTFDTEPSAAKDVTGLWSYYIGAPSTGKPVGCSENQDQEVGVRNSNAPPWEGRAVGFGNPALGSTDFKTRNAMIQQVLLATRPYGATPIAGMLDDARTYFVEDTSADPLNPSIKFGPLGDPAEKCRRKSIVLLSDGQPNLDLRPFCEPGGCPYEKAEDIALDLKARDIDVYVIGFALSKVVVGGVEKACKSIKGDDLNAPTGVCATDLANTALQACCALNRIAAAGGPTPPPGTDEDKSWQHAHFADNRDELRHELSQAIGGNFGSTTRTPFVNAQGGGFVARGSENLSFARAFRFAASFTPGKLDNAWIGELNRGRYICKEDGGVIKPVLADIDASKGDKFVDNVNFDGPSARKLFSVVGDAPAKSEASMRPNLVLVDDGIGTYKGTQNVYATPESFAQIPASALDVTETTCDSSNVNLTANECRSRYLRWLVGLDNTGVPYKRCPGGVGGEKCNLIAEFYHSVPKAVAGRPSQFLVDSSYQSFVKAQLDAKRPSVLYASSNDGFLHAFKIGPASTDATEPGGKVMTRKSNELWAFVPPGVLTGIKSFYPGTHQLLLDGTPAIRDVVATRDESLVGYKYRLQRNLADARVGIGAWRTILVQSYGAKRSGYFALDVTDPVVDDAGNGGPKFLWQLNTDATDKPLFGTGGGTPLITTVFLEGVETAVAVLPGGYGPSGDTSTGCDRKTTLYTLFDDAYKPRSTAGVPCYGDRAIQARSLTVVRLDNGQILRTFRQAEAEVPGLVGKNVWTYAPLDSPMTGQPVAFPADVGSVADRVFIGDQDGALWRLNFAGTGGDKTKASEWTLELFFDTFPAGGDFGHTRLHGQPIVNAPILSVDERGDLTIAVSTGDQEAIGAGGGINYVWSLTERAVDNRKALKPVVNWFLPLKGPLAGDRVIGEMALFAGELYFTTVGPDSAGDACSSGNGKVWGMHYLNPKNKGDLSAGGVPAPSLAALLEGKAYIDATTLLGSDAHAYLSGVSVGQQPTCDNPDASADDDGYFSYGVSPAHGAITPGRYQLIIPTGDKASSSTKPGVTPITQGGVNAVAVDLGTPLVMNYVDSWAAIVE
jgi:type IV pilus assembly protein PilY1